jgi:hypothetical protein
VFLFAGFLVSVEVFREIRIPFTDIRLATARRERARRRDREATQHGTPASTGSAGTAGPDRA